VTEIHDEIEILAPPDVVWETFTAFDSYAIWNPFIRRVIAPVFDEGETLEAFLRPSGQRGMRIRPEVLELRPAEKLRWESHVLHPWILHGEHTFLFYPTTNGTLFVQRLKFRGLLTLFITAIIYSDTLRGMEEMNAALKVRVERFHTPAPAMHNA
jgi:hypothetical protein